MKLADALLWRFARQAAGAWVDDYAPSMGAALAYYTMFSIAPLLLIAISVAGLVFGRDAASAEVIGQLHGLIGEKGAQAIQGMLESASQPAESTLATLIGGLALLVGATSVFGELQDDLDRIWRAPARVQAGGLSGLWNLLRSRLLSFGMVLGIGFLLMTSLVLSAGMAALGRWSYARLQGWELVATALNFVISYGLVTLMFALIYKVIPRVHIAWRDVWIGALATALLFNVGKLLIGLYIGKSGITSVFGAAGSLAVLLLWVYYSAQIFLLGAEFTWAYAHAAGSRQGGPEEAGVAADVVNAAAVPVQRSEALPPVSSAPPEDSSKLWHLVKLGLMIGGVLGVAADLLRMRRARAGGLARGIPLADRESSIPREQQHG